MLKQNNNKLYEKITIGNKAILKKPLKEIKELDPSGCFVLLSELLKNCCITTNIPTKEEFEKKFQEKINQDQNKPIEEINLAKIYHILEQIKINLNFVETKKFEILGNLFCDCSDNFEFDKLKKNIIKNNTRVNIKELKKTKEFAHDLNSKLLLLEEQRIKRIEEENFMYYLLWLIVTGRLNRRYLGKLKIKKIK